MNQNKRSTMGRVSFSGRCLCGILLQNFNSNMHSLGFYFRKSRVTHVESLI